MDASFRVAEVPASRGTAWLTDAFGLFRAAPMQWIALCAGWIAITFGLLMGFTVLRLPIAGGAIASLLQPVFFASFAITAYRQSAGETIVMGDLFSGFKHKVRSLVNLGAILLLAQIGISVLMAVLGLPVATSPDGTFTMEEYVELLKGKEWILATGFLLTVAVKGALWFAPPLIAFHGMATVQAMRWSLYACVANVGAMLVYGATLLAFFIAAILPWGLGLVVVIPLMAISTYIGYREVFEAKA